jgi:flagellar FliL protein
VSKKRILIFAGVPLVVVLLVGGGVYFATGGFSHPIVLSISFQSPQAAAAIPAEAAPVAQVDPVAAPAAEANGIMIDLGSKVVNLADPGGYRYLRVSLVLEMSPAANPSPALKEEDRKKAEQAVRDGITQQRPMVDDAVVGVLSNKAFGDIFTLQGKEDLKQELLQAINERLSGPEVAHVYFTDFVIQ